MNEGTEAGVLSGLTSTPLLLLEVRVGRVFQTAEKNLGFLSRKGLFPGSKGIGGVDGWRFVGRLNRSLKLGWMQVFQVQPRLMADN